MNRRSLLMILMGASCAPLLPRSAWAQEALTEAKKKQLREAIAYPQVHAGIEFVFNEDDGVVFGTETSESERKNALKIKNQAKWERLSRATEPADPEAKADFFAERGGVAADLDKTEEAEKDRAIAAGLYRDLAAKTDDVAKKADFLAKAATVGQKIKGEKVALAVADAREAVRLAPASEAAWRALGGALLANAFNRLSSSILGAVANMTSGPMNLLPIALQNPAAFCSAVQSPGFAAIQEDVTETCAAYRRAFELKPDAKGALSLYGLSLFFQFFFDAARMLPKDNSTPAAFGESLAKAARQSDARFALEKALELPVDPIDLTPITFFYIAGIGVFGQEDSEAALKNMPPSDRKLIEKVAQRFTDLRKDTKQDTQARLSASFGVLLISILLQNDKAEMEATLKEARALAPQDIRLLELSLAIAGSREDYAGARQHAEALLRSRDIAFYHLLYARILRSQSEAKGLSAQEKQILEKQMLASYRTALKLEPENVLAAIGVAVSLMKSSDTQPDQLREAGMLLKKTAESTNDTRSKEDTLPLLLATIGFYGLDDQMEEARATLKRAQEAFEDDDDLKALAKILEA
jgi:cytochrome c-type biogenesis protein CcmH/NrfG